MKTVNLILFLNLFTGSLFAQFTHKANVETTTQTGFYSIVLSPEIRGYSCADLHDLRLYDLQGTEIPYIIRGEEKNYAEENFIILPLLTKKHGVSIEGTNDTKENIQKGTILIIENTTQQPIKSFYLHTANANVTKHYRLLGSNDQENWYSISDEKPLPFPDTNAQSNVYIAISFPVSDYRYFKLQINDTYSAPLNIIDVGYFKNTVIHGQKAAVAHRAAVSQNKKEKKTYVQVYFDTPQEIEQLTLMISSPAYYKRSAYIEVERTRMVNKKVENYTAVIASFDLQSDLQPDAYTVNLCEQQFTLVIYDGDNPPLSIDSLICWQSLKYLVFQAKAEEQYVLYTGDAKLPVPRYDLAFFDNQIPVNVNQLHLQDIQNLPAAPTDALQQSFWQRAWFMWCCLAIACLGITYVCYTMLQEIKNKKHTHTI